MTQEPWITDSGSKLFIERRLHGIEAPSVCVYKVLASFNSEKIVTKDEATLGLMLGKL